MHLLEWIVTAASAGFLGYRLGKRDQWIEPHCYCRGDQPDHACLQTCWEGHRLRSPAFQRHMRRPKWLRRFYTER